MGKKKRPGFKNWNKIEDKLLEPKHWEEVVKENTYFAVYYKAQNLIKSDDEWNTFLNILKEHLPLSFRFVSYRGKGRLLCQRMFSDFINKLPKSVPRPFPLPWCPNNHSWQHDISRSEIRSVEVLKEYHKFLLCEADCGNLVRQETVSQIPPLLLHVKPHHIVLDTCASPGSKTSQLIDMLHQTPSPFSLHSTTPHTTPTGCIVANDASNPRCYTMTHNLKRYASPCLIVTNHNAVVFPNILVAPHHSASPPNSEKTILIYDRILCDVPCTGDATLRKNYTIWAKWHSKNANSLHRLQLAILRRAIQLLKNGGRLVYSTCSFNPVENEAVIAAALNAFGLDKIQLVDVSDQLEGLKRDVGMTHWSVFVDENNSFKSYSEYKETTNLPKNVRLQPTLFPPKSEETEKFNLERCVRILPHRQNTGGFFVAVLEKKTINNGSTEKNGVEKSSVISTAGANNDKAIVDDNVGATEDECRDDLLNPEELASLDNLASPDIAPPPAKQARFKGLKEDPFVYITDIDNDVCVSSLKNDFGISGDDFPFRNLLKRKDTDAGRKVSITSDFVRRIVSVNDNSRLKVIHAGSVVLDRRPSEESDLGYRLVQDGLDLILQHISKRIILLSLEDVTKVLIKDSVAFQDFSAETQQVIGATGAGSIVLKFEASSVDGMGGDYKRDEKDESQRLSFAFCAWKGRFTIRAYIKPCEREHFLRLSGQSDEEVRILREKFEKEKEDKQQQAEENCDKCRLKEQPKEMGAETEEKA